jgi:hypothetical protein
VAAYRDLPELQQWRPAFLGDIEAEGWIGLLLEDLSGTGRVPPWTPEAVATVAAGLGSLHRATAGGRRPRGMSGPEVWAPYFTQLRGRGRTLGRLPFEAAGDEWWEWLEEACSAGDRALASYMSDSVPRCVIHCDVRSDNLFIRDGRMLLVDWSPPIWDSPAIDATYWALGVELEAGIEAEEAYATYRSHGLDPGAEGLRGAVAMLAGLLLDRLQGNSSPPHIAELQLQLLPHALRWLARELSLPAPPN